MDNGDEYGFQKERLRAILTARRERRRQDEGVVTPQPPPAEPAAPADSAEEHGAVTFDGTPETHESHPDLFIEVRTPELTDYQGWEVMTGRMLITYRRRTDADGDLAFITEPAQSRLPLAPVRREPEDLSVWRNRFHNHNGTSEQVFRYRTGMAQESHSERTTTAVRRSRFACFDGRNDDVKNN